MTQQVKIITNRYVDSVSLMALSTRANSIEGISEAIIAMGTEMNKEVMKSVGLSNKAVEAAEASDLIITIKTDAPNKDLIEDVAALLDERAEKVSSDVELTFTTIDSAHDNNPETNLALISVNGQYAYREGMKALQNGMNVMMFSDNVSIEHEKKLKEYAHENSLLMMGPDCGTASINQVGLGFSNKVKQGNIGIIGASGTGTQEMMVRIDEFGGGVSQVIGTGGRDLSLEIGGRMMLDSMELLDADKDTEVIVLVSKKPDEAVEKQVTELARKLSKPVVIWFLGTKESKSFDTVYIEKMSKEAAFKAVELAGIDVSKVDKHPLNLELIAEVRQKLKPTQKYVRGLFSGGTLCGEAVFLAEEKLTNIHSNVSDENPILNKDVSVGHTYIDFGSDEYTDGRAHPMIDPTVRIERFKEEAKDPEVAVILLDFVLGYGSHADPVGVMKDDITEAIANAKAEGRHLEIIGYVLGTNEDQQNLDRQVRELIDAGATYASSSQNAGLLAREMVLEGENNEK